MVTLYLLSCNSNSDKPLKNLGNLEVSGLDAEGNEMISEVNDEVLNRIIMILQVKMKILSHKNQKSRN